MIHAGLVARDGAGILLAGPSGCGKSTTALACLRAGFRYLSDDCVGLEARRDGAFIGHSLFGSMTLEADRLRRYPALAGHGLPGRVPWEDKLLVLLSDVWTDRLARRARIRAIALPRVTDSATTTLRTASERDALMRLAPSSLRMVPRAAMRRALDGLRSLVRATPTFWLDLAGDPDRVVEPLDAVVEP